MTEASAILVIVSRALEYPNHHFLNDYPNMKEMINEYIGSPNVQKELEERVKPLYSMTLNELQQLYVETFDYKESTALYMTAHELGDSPKRGQELIKMQELVHEAGYECKNNELADYIPMLLELLAVVPEVGEYHFLKRRLGYAINRVVTSLSSSNLYHQVLELLMMFVFETPKSEEIIQLEKEREQADLDPLPYPMLYQ